MLFHNCSRWIASAQNQAGLWRNYLNFPFICGHVICCNIGIGRGCTKKNNDNFMKLIVQIIPLLIFIIFGILPAWIVLKFYNKRIKNRKSPLNIDLLRGPGEYLHEKINDVTDDIVFNLFILPVIPILVYSLAISNFFPHQQKISIFLVIFFCLLIIASTSYLCLSVYKLLNKRNILRLGRECEVAIGQDLNNLLVYGFKVYHDFQANNFNIDHIAIGPTGVFAVETKGRSKSVKSENNNWMVNFDGKKLIFPDWTEKKPIEQAINQANWLTKWIHQSTGEQINVRSVIAIPGWYISRTAKSDMLTINGKNSVLLAKGKRIITDKQIQTIAFQIENACRDIPVKSYKQIAQK